MKKRHWNAKYLAALMTVSSLGVVVAAAQESYRTQQSLRPTLAQSSRTKADDSSTIHPVPRPSRFLGWKAAAKQGPEMVEYFAGLAGRQQPMPRAASTLAIGDSPAAGQTTAITMAASLPGLELRPSLPAGVLPAAIVVGDFNKDGKLDWAIANGSDCTIYIYLGNGDGTAQPPAIIPLSGKSPIGLAVGDLNHDGNLDLAVAEADSQAVGVLLGKGDGTFKTETLLPAFAVPTTAVAVLDVNHDGFPDLVIGFLGNFTTAGDSSFAVELNDGSGNFGAPIYAPNSPSTQYPSAQEFSSADVNKDGYLDLLVTSVSTWNGTSLVGGGTQIFLGNGDGTFAAGQVIDSSDPGGLVPQLVQNAALADVNGDGCPDAVVVDSYGDAAVYSGDCSGGFSTAASGGALIYGMGDNPYGMAVADVNGDGRPDIVTGGIPLPQDMTSFVGIAIGNTLGVRLNDGSGHFGPLQVFTGDPGMFSLAVADLSNNGRPAVISANQNSNTATVFLNDGSGGFGSPSGGYDGEYESGVTGFFNPPKSGFLAADLNGDGLPDLALIEADDASTELLQITAMLNEGSGKFGMPVRTPAFRSDYIVNDFAFAHFRNSIQNDFVGVAFDDSTSCGQPQLIYAPDAGNGTFGAPVQIPLTLANACFAFPILGLGDFNHDGKLDFAIASATGPSSSPLQITVYLGNGNGTFQAAKQANFAIPSGPPPQAIFVEDANDDGKADLLIWLSSNGYGSVPSGKDLLELLGNGDGTFQQPIDVIQNLYAMTMRDLNHDGKLDVINIHSGSPAAEDTPGTAPAQVTTYLGNSDGSFTLKSTTSPFPGYLDTFFGNTASSAPSDFSLSPYVGDFNGDGTPDVAVFQRTRGLGPAYAQFLVGNGDGTFTSTYDIYPLGIFRAPDLAVENMFGDGRAASLYTPNYSASYSILPAIAAPAIQADILETPVLSSADSLQISLNVRSSSSTSVTLSASDPGVQIASSATIPANTLQVGVPFTLAASFPANQWFSITAQANGTSAVAYSYSPQTGVTDPFTIAAFGGFVPPGEGSSPAPGQESDWDAVVSTASMASSTFRPSCIGLPAGTSCQNFVPATLPVPPAGTAATNFTITPPVNLAPGSYPFTVSATDGFVTRNAPATLLVGDFSLGLTPASVTTQATSVVNLNLNIGELFGYNQPIDFACSNLPSGASCNIEASSDLIVLNLTNVAVGTYTFTVTGTSNSLVHSANLQLRVISTPVISFEPTFFSVPQAVVGGTASSVVQVSNSGSAALSISNITLDASGTAGTLGTSNTCSGSVAPGALCMITVNFAATAVGTVNGTLTINDNANPSPQTVPIIAQGVDFTLRAANGGSTTATVNAGQTGTFSLEVAPNQFSGIVDLRCTNPPPRGTCTVESNVNITGNSPVTFQVTVVTTASSRKAALAYFPISPSWGPTLVFSVVSFFAFVLGHGKRKELRQRLKASRVGLLLLVVAATLSSCGGGGGSGGGPTTGTPPDTYTLTITGTAGGVNRSIPLTLVVK